MKECFQCGTNLCDFGDANNWPCQPTLETLDSLEANNQTNNPGYSVESAPESKLHTRINKLYAEANELGLDYPSDDMLYEALRDVEFNAFTFPTKTAREHGQECLEIVELKKKLKKLETYREHSQEILGALVRQATLPHCPEVESITLKLRGKPHEISMSLDIDR